MNDFLNIIYPSLNTVLTAGIIALMGVALKGALDIIPVIYNYLTLKYGVTKMAKLKSDATDIFYKIKQNGKVGTLIGTEFAVFEKLITSKYPSITSVEIEDIRDTIFGQLDLDKAPILAALEQTTPVKEQPAPTINMVATVKYMAPDGITELTPVTAATATSDVTGTTTA
jgi:hypothetical protein